MARPAKPYRYRGWYVTDYGGVPHRRLCRLEEGEKAAEIALARLKVQFADGTLPEGLPTKLIGHVCDEYLALSEANNKRSTFTHYQDKLVPFVEKFGNKPIAQLTPTDGANYKRELTERLSLTSVGVYLRVAKQVLNWASRPPRSYIPTNPWVEIKLPKSRERERVITDAEFQALLDECKNGNVEGAAEDFREVLITLRFTGFRPHELCNLKCNHVKFDQHQLVLPAFDRQSSLNKTSSRRSVTMIDAVEEIVRRRYDRQHGKGYLFPSIRHDGTKYVFDPSMRKSPNRLSQRFGYLVKRCVEKGLIEAEKGEERLVLYSSRHTRITELVAGMLPLKAVMDEAGHVNSSTTHRYTHLADDFRTELVRNLGKESND